MSKNPDEGLGKDEAERLAELRRILDEAGADYQVLFHQETVVSAEDGVKRGMGSLAEMAPTLILDTERGFIAAIICGDTRLSYKKIKKQLGLGNVSLAKPNVVLQVTGARIGTVSLINPGLPTIVDCRLARVGYVYGGCGIPRHTLRIRPEDLIRVTQARVLDLAEIKDGSDC